MYQQIAEYVQNHPVHRPGFVDHLWSNTIGKLCFGNGWFDFHTQSFHAWEDQHSDSRKDEEDKQVKKDVTAKGRSAGYSGAYASLVSSPRRRLDPREPVRC